jgi:hypothetical protein
MSGNSPGGFGEIAEEVIKKIQMDREGDKEEEKSSVIMSKF